jgi:hypothetical protein
MKVKFAWSHLWTLSMQKNNDEIIMNAQVSDVF